MQSTVLTDKRSINEISALIEFCSQLVIKNEDEINQYETNESISEGYKLINAMLRVDNYESYVVTQKDLHDLDNDEIVYSMYTPDTLPFDLRDEVLEYKRFQVYRDYLARGDLNKYYNDIYNQYIKDEESVMSYEEFKANTNLCFFVVARLSKNYSLLWYPKTILSTTEILKFKKCYLYCQQYYLKVCYNDAYKESNPKYNNLSTLMIVFMTIKRYVNARLENIDDIDFFDEYSIRNMFLSYGLDYFFDMPLKYQKRVLKNINYLIKNKGTNKAIICILEMFGFQSIKVMKYLLCKEYPRDKATGQLLLTEPELKFYGIDSEEDSIEHGLKNANVTDYEIFTNDDKYWQIDKYDENGDLSNDYSALLAEPFNYIYTKYISIEGVMDVTKAAIDFSYYINFLYRLKEKINNDPNTTQSLYFYNYTLSNNKIDLIDSIFLLYAIIMKKFGYKDVIVKTVSGISKVYDFNLDKEKTPTYFFKKQIKREDVILNDYIDYIPKIENVSDKDLFNQQKMIPISYDIVDNKTLQSVELDVINSQLITYEWLYLEDYTVNKYKSDNLIDFDKEVTRVSFVKQFTSNNAFRKKLENIILATHDREFYRKYMAYYKKCFLSEYRSNIFGKYDTFTNYLKVKDPTCYSVLEKIQAKIEETPADEEVIYYEYILELCNSIDTYLDSDEMDFVVQGNVYLTDYVKTFIYEMVEFIRAYTIYVKEISTIYLFDNRFTNKLKFFDEADWDHIQKYTLLYKFNDKTIIDNKMVMSPEDMLEFIKETYTWVTSLSLEDREKLSEELDYNTVSNIADLVRFNDSTEVSTLVKYIDGFNYREQFRIGEHEFTFDKDEKFTLNDFFEVFQSAIYNLKELNTYNDRLDLDNQSIVSIDNVPLKEQLQFSDYKFDLGRDTYKLGDSDVTYTTEWRIRDLNNFQDSIQIVSEFTNIEQFNMKEGLTEVDNALDNLLIFKDTLDKCKLYEDVFIAKYDLNRLVTKKIYIKQHDEEFYIKSLGAILFYIAGDTEDKRTDYTIKDGILILSKRHGEIDYIAMSNTEVEFDTIDLIKGDINNE